MAYGGVALLSTGAWRFMYSKLAGAALFMLCSIVARAQDWQSLKDTAVALFDAEDIRLMIANADAVAELAGTPSSRSWNNAATGHSGTAESLRAFAGPAGVPCKSLRVTNIADERRGVTTYSVCKFASCGWRVVPREYLEGSRYAPSGDPCSSAAQRRSRGAAADDLPAKGAGEARFCAQL